MALALALISANLLAAAAVIGTGDDGGRVSERGAAPSDFFILRVVVRTPGDVALLSSGGYDLLEAREGDALFVLGDAQVLASLRTKGFDVAVHTQLPALDAPFVSFGYFGGYRTVAEHEAHMSAVAAERPDLALVVDYGDSWRKITGRPDGHDLKAICITKRRPGDCRLDPDTDKPRFLLIAAIHARELSASEMAWRWIDFLVDGYEHHPDVTWLLNYHELWVIPVANPDGRHWVEQGGAAPYLQRKNMNDSQGACGFPPGDANYAFRQPGVDLNRNASFRWGVSGVQYDSCAQTYPGLNPASEPEQYFLEQLMGGLFADQRGPLDGDAAPITTTGAMLTLHSYGDLVLLPWSWVQCSSECLPSQRAPNDAGLRAFAFRMSHFNGYAAGQASELLYPASGTTDDWAYGVLGIPGFTFEIGPISGACGGFTPPYACQDDVFWPLNRDAFLYAAKVARQPYALSPGPTVLSVALSDNPVDRGQPVTLTVAVSDDAYGDDSRSVGRPVEQAIAAVEVYVDMPPWANGTPIALTALDGAFDSPAEIAIGRLDTMDLGVGRRLLFVRGRNAAGHWGPVTAQWLVVMGSDALYLPIVGR